MQAENVDVLARQEENIHLEGDGEADEVDDDVLVGQLDGEDGERGEEQLEVLVDVVFLLTAQVDVAVQLLAVLQRSQKVTEGQRSPRGTQEEPQSRARPFTPPSS